MSLANIPHEELQAIIGQLDQALYNHREWYRLLVRTLVCRLPCDRNDLVAESYKVCRFGQWYYNYSNKNLSEHPRFIAIGKEHQRMHESAQKILSDSEINKVISTQEYDDFANSLERLQLEIFALTQELEKLIHYHDPLTKAINRLYMLPILHEKLGLIKRNVYEYCCLVMVDLDNFKNVNDEYGHAAGDKVLSAVVKYFAKHLRSYDKVFRYGGEEFLLLLEDVDIKGGLAMAKRLREGLSKLIINIGDGEKTSITASFGLTLLDPGLSIEESIEQADKASYEAKSAGRNCVKVFKG